MKSLEVVCAVILNSDGKLLACKRNSSAALPGKWEFPGGKVESGESKEEALEREILEELEVSISILKPLTSVMHHYSELDIKIHLMPYLCEIKNTKAPQPLEHAQIRWIHPSNADELDWADADQIILNSYKNSLT